MDALKILVVDDEARMRKLVRDFLTNKGFAVIEAGDGEEAVDTFFAQKDIALVLLDVMMPKMDGWGGVKDHPQIFPGARNHADSQKRGAGRASGILPGGG